MAGGLGEFETPFPVKGLRLAMPVGYLFEDLDDHVASSFEKAIDWLSAAGAHVEELSIESLSPSPCSQHFPAHLGTWATLGEEADQTSCASPTCESLPYI